MAEIGKSFEDVIAGALYSDLAVEQARLEKERREREILRKVAAASEGRSPPLTASEMMEKLYGEESVPKPSSLQVPKQAQKEAVDGSGQPPRPAPRFPPPPTKHT